MEGLVKKLRIIGRKGRGELKRKEKKNKTKTNKK